jgi:hypothetical protein
LLYWVHIVIIINKASLSSLPLLSSFLPRTQGPQQTKSKRHAGGDIVTQCTLVTTVQSVERFTSI